MRQKIQYSLLFGEIGKEHIVEADDWVDSFDIFAFGEYFEEQIEKFYFAYKAKWMKNYSKISPF